MDRIDHFQAIALALAYEKNISIEEAQEILYNQTLELHNEFLRTHTNSIQIEKDNATR